MNFLKRLILRDSIPPYELQNKKTWSVLITHYDEVPVDYKAFFEPMREQGKPIPFSVFTPSYDVFSTQSTEKLVCLTESDLFIVNKNETFEKALRFSFKNIWHIQFRTVLLDSNISIVGTDDHGEAISANVRFNTVSDSLFKKIIKTIRQNSFTSSENKEPFSFDEFRTENFKFANFAQHCLIPGEKVVQLIWQPELLQSLFHIHNSLFSHSFFPRRVIPNHVLMLTDQEVILISEDNQYSHVDRYGGIWDYISLNKIRKTILKQDQDGLITLSIELPENQWLETRYLPTLRSELDILLINIKK